MRAVKDGGLYLVAQMLRGKAEMHLEHLTDIHSGGNAQGVEHDIERRAVRKEGHILLRKYSRNNTLVAVAACHLIADGELTLLGDIAADNLVYAGCELIAVLAGELFDLDNNAVFAVGDLEGGVSDLLGLLAEYRAEKSLLGSQLGLALGRYLTDKDIAGVNLGADADYAALVKVAQKVVGDVRDIPCNLLGSELCISRLDLVLLDVNRGVDIVANHLFVDEDRVLVVVALPSHEADKGVLAEGYLAVIRSGAVGYNIALLNALVEGDYRALVDAGALVGAHELDYIVVVENVLVAEYLYLLRVDLCDASGVLRKHDNAGVDSRLVLHTGADNRALGLEQRNRLLLHVRAHEGAVCVVVLEERDHGGCDGDDHLGRNIHVVDLHAVNFKEAVSVSCVDSVMDELAVLVERLVSLGDNEIVLDVSSHILDLVCDAAGGLVNLSERSLYEAVLVYTREGCKVGDKSDVGAFGSLNGAHSAVMRIVNVSNLEACTVSRKTAGAEGGKTALMSKLGKRVYLIHELRQR